MLRLLKKPGLKPTNIFPESQQRGDVFVEGGGAAPLMAPSPPGFPAPTRGLSHAMGTPTMAMSRAQGAVLLTGRNPSALGGSSSAGQGCP